MKKARLDEIEILRGIAFLAVVLQHVIGGIFSQPGLSSSAILAGTTFLGLTRFAVPLFVFITGVVLFYNYDGELHYRSFLRKRFSQVVLPYLAWTVFYYVWVSFLSGTGPSTTWEELLNLLKLALTGRASYHLWFMVMIIPFYLLFPLFKKLLSKERKPVVNLIAAASVLVVNGFLVFALSKGWIVSDHPFLQTLVIDYLDRNFLFWTFYFVMGGLVGLYYDKWKKIVQKTWLIGLLLSGVCLYMIYAKITGILSLRDRDLYLYAANVSAPLRPLMMGTILILIVLAFALAMGIARRSGLSVPSRILIAFGRYSFGAYLIHAFVLRSTNELAKSYLSWLNVYGQAAVSFVLCAAISLFLCLWISRMKLTVGEAWVGKI
ncbi:acyltransferase [Paenibacillus macerans]|uniref:acyltransferase n=1 Tax=Paenibacillus macerans TaxID=44252 RepID=UPI003D321017